MSTAFEKAIAFVLPHETEFERGHYGDYAHARTENVPGDGGGLTKFGIDQRSHPHTNITGLTKDDAVKIYRESYWDKHNLDSFPDPINIALFDIFVNGGHPIEWLQRAINDLPDSSEKLTEDGNAGPKTMAAVVALTKDQIKTATGSILDQRANRFKRLAEKPQLAQFLNGWLARNNDLRALILQPA